MNTPKSYESQLLEPVERLLAELAGDGDQDHLELRLQLLEAAASCLGQFSLENYFASFDLTPVRDCIELRRAGEQIAKHLQTLPIHYALALSSLAREPLPVLDQRSTGAYYTDFRLAKHLASQCSSALQPGIRILDPACGTGILLAAISIQVANANPQQTAHWLANSVYAADLSAIALRGARLALASLTDDLGAIQQMWSHWRIQDSLLAAAEAWSTLVPEKFDLIVGNPPWEKVRLTRHEYLNASGAKRHYGEEYEVEAILATDYLEKRAEVASYSQRLRGRYDLLGSGEPDLYMAFVQLSTELVKHGGQVKLIVPAGLIRSQGTQSLRRYLLSCGRKITITVMENRARFFAIDSRFKFLLLSFIREERKEPSEQKETIRLNYAEGSPIGVAITSKARVELDLLAKLRADLTVPEVRNNAEWRMFVSMMERGMDWSNPDSLWYPDIMREVDMTRSRSHFLKAETNTALPVIEGRMIQAHRFGAKKYVSGSGRRAVWAPVATGSSGVVPQFWIEADALGSKSLERSQHLRASFCDIAGQTNERSMTAALVPAGVICGNKVPTIRFPHDPSEERLLLWTGIVNSFPFDWMLRRVLTTTVNYFLLLGIPLPPIQPDESVGQTIISATRKLREMDTSSTCPDPWEMAELRAMIDLEVLIAYGLGYEELMVILGDFPLLDRGQPPISGEDSSTITRDYLLACASHRFNLSDSEVARRVAMARTAGAVPYIPSEMAAVHGCLMNL